MLDIDSALALSWMPPRLPTKVCVNLPSDSPLPPPSLLAAVAERRNVVAVLTGDGAAGDLKDLSIPSSNQFEARKGDRKGAYGIRINKRWRICFKWRDGHAFDVEIVDYH